MSAADPVFLQAALELAERGRLTCAPNPTVGCIIWREGRVLGRGWHARTGEAHAEVNAIADAGGDVTGATVYVTLEPCAFVSHAEIGSSLLMDLSMVVPAARKEEPFDSAWMETSVARIVELLIEISEKELSRK